MVLGGALATDRRQRRRERLGVDLRWSARPGAARPADLAARAEDLVGSPSRSISQRELTSVRPTTSPSESKRTKWPLASPLLRRLKWRARAEVQDVAVGVVLGTTGIWCLNALNLGDNARNRHA